MVFTIKKEKEFSYIEKGEGEVLLLLHGLFGALSNWEGVLKYFSPHYKVVIPSLPIYVMPLRKMSLESLVKFIEAFVEFKKFESFTLVGSSLGGHLGLIYTLRYPEKIKRLVLIGSSGLSENTRGTSFPKRNNYNYIKERVEYTFFDPKTATQAYVDKVFRITGDIPKALCIAAIARAAQKNNMAQEIVNIKAPTLLVWGLNDTITPPMVAHEFNRLITNSKLQFIDECCHAPMMEHPEKFNYILDQFLQEHITT